MAELPNYIIACFHTGKLALLAILVSGGIVLQILACALYKNWWPMLSVIMYVLLPMPLLFFAGSDTSSLFSESESRFASKALLQLVTPITSFLAMTNDETNRWASVTKFLTGASAVGSIAIPSILKHAGVICWGAFALDLSSFCIFGAAILCYIRMNSDDDYSIL